MARKPAKDERGLSDDDWSAIGQWIKAEKDRRAGNQKRRLLEQYWAEVDRQVAMSPAARKNESGTAEDWLPDTELPLQFNTLEVNCADARRLKFPRGSEWYQASADLSDAYMNRWRSRRQTRPLFPGSTDMALTQDTANTLTKAVVDHYHRQYDFRSAIDLFDVECIKYGTGIVRVKEVLTREFFNDFRGTLAQKARGPAVVPTSIKTVYLDDTPSAVMHEGMTVAPGHIRCLSKKLFDIKNAIRTGGPERGWRQAAIKRLEPRKSNDDKNETVELIEYEGDLIVPRAKGEPIFLPGVTVAVAACQSPEVVRFLVNEYPFPTYTVGYYMRDDLDTPYGTGPLIKGQPIQEAATAVLNSLLTAAALSAQPPCFYDANDHKLTAQGGPKLFPGAMNPVYSPEAMNFMERADVSPLYQAYLGLVKQYEDLTAVNDPRRGGPMRSHTTAAGMDIEQSRGLSRTDDFVQGQMYGPITSVLHKEYEIIKRVMSQPTDVHVDAGGIEGWLKVSASDLPDNVAFQVFGSAGTLNDRQSLENFMAATNTALQIEGVAANFGQQIRTDFARIIQEIFKRAGVNNAGALFEAAPSGGADAGGASAQPALPPGAPGVPTNTLASVQAVSGI